MDILFNKEVCVYWTSVTLIYYRKYFMKGEDSELYYSSHSDMLWLLLERCEQTYIHLHIAPTKVQRNGSTQAQLTDQWFSGVTSRRMGKRLLNSKDWQLRGSYITKNLTVVWVTYHRSWIHTAPCTTFRHLVKLESLSSTYLVYNLVEGPYHFKILFETCEIFTSWVLSTFSYAEWNIWIWRKLIHNQGLYFLVYLSW